MTFPPYIQMYADMCLTGVFAGFGGFHVCKMVLYRAPRMYVTQEGSVSRMYAVGLTWRNVPVTKITHSNVDRLVHDGYYTPCGYADGRTYLSGHPTKNEVPLFTIMRTSPSPETDSICKQRFLMDSAMFQVSTDITWLDVFGNERTDTFKWRELR